MRAIRPAAFFAFTTLALAGLPGCSAPALNASGPSNSAQPPIEAITTISRHGDATNNATTVVLQSGLQDDRSSWNAVQPLIAQYATVVSHDRPGRGNYSTTSAPRDPCTLAAEQRSLLQRAGLKPPYLLVGHSLGGLYQFAFARLYPDEVAGLVLIDPTHPAHWATMQRDHPGSAALLRAVRLTLFNTTDGAEFDAQSECLDRLPPVTDATIPTRLLVSGQRRPEELGMVGMIETLRKDWQRLLGIESMEVVKDAGHYLHQERPERLVNTVRDVLGEIELRQAAR